MTTTTSLDGGAHRDSSHPDAVADRRAVEDQVAEVGEKADRIRTSIASVLHGKDPVIETALCVLLAEGHLLLEDVPGVGKTMLSKALARSIDCSTSRIQFTPDLLPSDITGVSIYNQERGEFEFRPGGVFAHIVLGDEINRASPKTQSALLECMEEHQVTVDGETWPLHRPFMVIATQNPVEMEGTYALPEAQRDRFMARVSLGYPAPEAEIAMLGDRTGSDPLDRLRPVVDTAEVARMTATVSRIHVAPALLEYAVALTTATRDHPEVLLGASPRATLHLVQAAKAQAALHRRAYVLPEDLSRMTVPLLAHRLMLQSHGHPHESRAEALVENLVRTVPVPR